MNYEELELAADVLEGIQETNLSLVVYPQGGASPVIDIDRFVKLLTRTQAVYLNGKLANVLLDNEAAAQLNEITTMVDEL